MSIFELFKKIESTKEEPSPIEFIVAGLGNPGEKYNNTRHNAGFLVVDELCNKKNLEITTLKFKSLCCRTQICGRGTLLLKPQTFMNLSGQAVHNASEFYKIAVKNIIVVCDDVSLPVGKIRIKGRGSSGGQNGLKDIIYLLNSDEFVRIKIGVGNKPHPDYDLADWVLSAFSQDEQKNLNYALKNACDAVIDIIGNGTYSAMNRFNGL